MAGDYTRFTFRPEHDHAAVLMQQGRVQLDADWNELVGARSTGGSGAGDRRHHRPLRRAAADASTAS